MDSGSRERLGELINVTERWSPLTVVHDYLVDLKRVAEGDLSVLSSLDKRLDEILALPSVPLAVVLMFGTAQYLPEEEPKRQGFLDRARAIAAERGWNGFVTFIDRT